jgi:hypothetical protein
MTTVTLGETATSARPAPSNRILAIVRLHFVSPSTVIVVPWMILGFIFIVNLAIWAIIFSSVSGESDRASVQEGLSYSGASFYIFVYMGIVALQAINLSFPLAQGYGVTRRDFYLGTSVAFVLMSAGYAAAVTLLSVLEDATNGWGFGGHMFTSVYFGTGPWYVRLGLFFTIFVFFFFGGMIFATVYVRWRAHGVLALCAAITVYLVAVGAVISLTASWPAVGDWFVSTGVNGVILWSLVPTAVAAVASYFMLRGATARN